MWNGNPYQMIKDSRRQILLPFFVCIDAPNKNDWAFRADYDPCA
jgi:hypothetical protein